MYLLSLRLVLDIQSEMSRKPLDIKSEIQRNLNSLNTPGRHELIGGI